MDKEELIELIDQFLNDKGMWHQFKEWIEKQGYTLEELGFKD